MSMAPKRQRGSGFSLVNNMVMQNRTIQVQTPQLALRLKCAGDDDEKKETFLELLETHGHLTRADFKRHLGWSARTVRAVAERCGTDVVRGQDGFCLTVNADVGEVQHTAEQMISQAKKMMEYGLGLKKRAHQKIGN